MIAMIVSRDNAMAMARNLLAIPIRLRPKKEHYERNIQKILLKKLIGKKEMYTI